MVNLKDLLTCYLSGQINEKHWNEWCTKHPELREMYRKFWEGRG